MSVWYSIQIKPQLQLNFKNGSKRGQKWWEMPGICQKNILHSNYETYESNFWHIDLYHIWVYAILYELALAYNTMSKTGKKRVKKR